MRTMRWGRTTAVALGAVLFTAAESAAQRFIPPGHRAGPGLCQIWIDGVPPGHQAAPFRCDRGRRITWAPLVREAYLDWYLSQPWGFVDLRLDWDRYGVRAAFFDVRAILEFERFHRDRYLRVDWRGDRYWDRYYDGFRDRRWRTAYRQRFIRDVRGFRRGRSQRGVRAPGVRYERGDWDDRGWDDRDDLWEDRQERREDWRDRWEDRRERERERREDWRDGDRDRFEGRRGRQGDDGRRRGEYRRDDDRRGGPPGNRGRRSGRGNGRGNSRGG